MVEPKDKQTNRKEHLARVALKQQNVEERVGFERRINKGKDRERWR